VSCASQPVLVIDANLCPSCNEVEVITSVSFTSRAVMFVVVVITRWWRYQVEIWRHVGVNIIVIDCTEIELGGEFSLLQVKESREK